MEQKRLFVDNEELIKRESWTQCRLRSVPRVIQINYTPPGIVSGGMGVLIRKMFGAISVTLVPLPALLILLSTNDMISRLMNDDCSRT
jgi:hypothetical protein